MPAIQEPLDEAVLRADLRRIQRRLRTRKQAILRDLARIAEAQALASLGPWLIALAARTPQGTAFLEAVDYSSGEARPIRFPLDPKRHPRAQVEKLFTEARRLQRGVLVAERRLTEVAADLGAIDALAAELEDLIARAASLTPWEARFRARFGNEEARVLVRRSPRDKKPPYRTFVGEGSVPIWVGRDAKRNDELSMHVARPHHVWLHARGVPGSHVVVALAKGSELTPALLIDAAHLAAHFSDARDEALAEITHTERRYVRKPRKSPPGAVTLDREHVLLLRVEPERLSRLLLSERFEANA